MPMEHGVTDNNNEKIAEIKNEEEPFNPDFVEVDRVLDVSEHVDTQTGEKAKHYLVKWKSLPYEDSTWELEEDVDDAKIDQFYKFTKVPSKSEWKPKKRPSSDQWNKLDKTPIYNNGNTLRPYQLEGLKWLKFSWYNGHNCILADEMGLGKTIQSLTFVYSVWEYGIRGPFLVIAPLSTVPNRQREFEGWTDMNVIVYHGSVTSKQMIQEYEFFFKNDNGKVIRDICKFNVLITTFEMIVTDYQDLRNFNWRVCVVDEAIKTAVQESQIQFEDVAASAMSSEHIDPHSEDLTEPIDDILIKQIVEPEIPEDTLAGVEHTEYPKDGVQLIPEKIPEPAEVTKQQVLLKKESDDISKSKPAGPAKTKPSTLSTTASRPKNCTSCF